MFAISNMSMPIKMLTIGNGKHFSMYVGKLIRNDYDTTHSHELYTRTQRTPSGVFLIWKKHKLPSRMLYLKYVKSCILCNLSMVSICPWEIYFEFLSVVGLLCLCPDIKVYVPRQAPSDQKKTILFHWVFFPVSQDRYGECVVQISHS